MTELDGPFPPNHRPQLRDDVLEAQKLFFDSQLVDSPLVDWARNRSQDFGETVEPNYVYMMGKAGKPHMVAWLGRSGMDFESGASYDMHHVACDCMPEAELHGDLEIMLTCDALATAVVRRAHEVRAEYLLPDILPVEPDEKLWTGGKQIVIGSMVRLLERDQKHPESWVANYMSGRHELPLLSVVLNRNVDELAHYASMLEEVGKVEIDNDCTIRLTQPDDPVEV